MGEGRQTKQLGEFLFFSYVFILCYGIFGVLIIPKWQIKVRGLFQYFLDDFWNFQHVNQIWTLTPLFCTQLQETYGNSLKHIIFSYLMISEIHNFQIVRPYWIPKMWNSFLVVFLFFKYGGSKTIGFSGRFQRNFGGGILICFGNMGNHKTHK